MGSLCYWCAGKAAALTCPSCRHDFCCQDCLHQHGVVTHAHGIPVPQLVKKSSAGRVVGLLAVLVLVGMVAYFNIPGVTDLVNGLFNGLFRVARRFP